MAAPVGIFFNDETRMTNFMSRAQRIFIESWTLGAVVCFGLSWNLDHTGPSEHPVSSDMDNAFRSTVCAVAWPLFLSVKLTQALRAEVPALP